MRSQDSKGVQIWERDVWKTLRENILKIPNISIKYKYKSILWEWSLKIQKKIFQDNKVILYEKKVIKWNLKSEYIHKIIRIS